MLRPQSISIRRRSERRGLWMMMIGKRTGRAGLSDLRAVVEDGLLLRPALVSPRINRHLKAGSGGTGEIHAGLQVRRLLCVARLLDDPRRILSGQTANLLLAADGPLGNKEILPVANDDVSRLEVRDDPRGVVQALDGSCRRSVLSRRCPPRRSTMGVKWRKAARSMTSTAHRASQT